MQIQRFQELIPVSNEYAEELEFGRKVLDDYANKYCLIIPDVRCNGCPMPCGGNFRDKDGVCFFDTPEMREAMK